MFILVTLTLFEWLQKGLLKPRNKSSEKYVLETTDISATLTTINEMASVEGAAIRNLMAQTVEGGYKVSFRADFGGGQIKKRRQQFFNSIISAPETKSLHNADEEAQSVL